MQDRCHASWNVGIVFENQQLSKSLLCLDFLLVASANMPLWEVSCTKKTTGWSVVHFKRFHLKIDRKDFAKQKSWTSDERSSKSWAQCEDIRVYSKPALRRLQSTDRCQQSPHRSYSNFPWFQTTFQNFLSTADRATNVSQWLPLWLQQKTVQEISFQENFLLKHICLFLQELHHIAGEYYRQQYMAL